MIFIVNIFKNIIRSKKIGKSKVTKQPSQKKELTPTKINKIPDKLPPNPDDLLKKGWKEITHKEQLKKGNSRTFERSKDDLKIRFDSGEKGKPGWKGKDHYHIYNPNRTGKQNHYLDSKGNPVPKNSKPSHISPSESPKVKHQFQSIKELKQSNLNTNRVKSSNALNKKMEHLKQPSANSSPKPSSTSTPQNSPTPNP